MQGKLNLTIYQFQKLLYVLLHIPEITVCFTSCFSVRKIKTRGAIRDHKGLHQQQK